MKFRATITFEEDTDHFENVAPTQEATEDLVGEMLSTVEWGLPEDIEIHTVIIKD
jgi:hypothetical protein